MKKFTGTTSIGSRIQGGETSISERLQEGELDLNERLQGGELPTDYEAPLDDGIFDETFDNTFE